MNQKIRPDDILSEEAQDLISRGPAWLSKSGILLIFFVFGALFWVGWFIRYPDVVIAAVEVTTHPSPVFLVSNSRGKIILLREGNTRVALLVADSIED